MVATTVRVLKGSGLPNLYSVMMAGHSPCLFMEQNPNKFSKLYFELRRKYGRPQGQWTLWCKRPKTPCEKEEVIIGAILTQRTNWRNVELAMANLRAARAASINGSIELGKKKLSVLVRPVGFYKQKTGYLLSLLNFIAKEYGSVRWMIKEPLPKLREELLLIKGVGPETADSILLYALEKPVFVIDEYTRRLIKREKISKNLSYEHLQKLFEKNLRRDYRLYQKFHALIVIDGKNSKN